MKLPLIAPLTDEELDALEETLLDYGNDDSVLGVSELDGFFTAIVSGPELIPPSRWLPALWGGADKQPEWENQQQIQDFMAILIQHMNQIVSSLMQNPEQFEPIFNMNSFTEEPVLIAEEWCFGYMRGVALGAWPKLPESADTWLDAIALHGIEENFSVLADLTLQEHQQTIAEIAPAARYLHAYWLTQRTPAENLPREAPEPVRATNNIGRNDPCHCGSGKKFKKCCLH